MTEQELQKTKELHNKHWYFKGKKDIINSIIEKYNPKTEKILDIGCGEGYFFDKYKGIGIEPCGLFKSDNILNKNIEDMDLKETFDTIICLDVLEHLENDSIILDIIDKNLKEGGIAIFTVPAHRRLFSRHDEINHHYRRYDKKDVLSLFNKYDNKDVVYINSLLYPIAYIVRKFSTKDNLYLPNKFINSVLYKIFSFEKHTYKYHFTGMSLLVIITK